jgi:hypothetical protein
MQTHQASIIQAPDLHNSDSGHKIASSVSTYVREKACMVGRHKATDHEADIHVKLAADRRQNAGGRQTLCKQPGEIM